MIPSQIPSVGVTVKFGDNNKAYKVKNVSEDIVWEDGKPKGTGDGWVCIVDDYGYEYVLLFDKFIPKENA